MTWSNPSKDEFEVVAYLDIYIQKINFQCSSLRLRPLAVGFWNIFIEFLLPHFWLFQEHFRNASHPVGRFRSRVRVCIDFSLFYFCKHTVIIEFNGFHQIISQNFEFIRLLFVNIIILSVKLELISLSITFHSLIFYCMFFSIYFVINSSCFFNIIIIYNEKLFSINFELFFS